MLGLRSRRPAKTSKTAPRARLAVEGLESRLVPYSVSGNAWPNPNLITIGFVPDGTVVGQNNNGNIASNLFANFNNRFGSVSVWQKEILKAAATWAQQTNINFKVVGDNGAEIGSGNYQQGDPNMADIRIGGYDFGTTTLSQAYLPAPLNNTSYAGDIQFNTGQTWNIGNTYDLYTVALHEFGHALGLNHGSGSSVMAQTYNGTVAGLTTDDINGIRAVTGYNLLSSDGYSSPGYGGARVKDTYDNAASNETSATASTITSAINTSAKTANIANLDLATDSDVDWYKFVVPSGLGGNLTVRVQSTGLSLLTPTLTVYNGSVSQLATSSAAGVYGATVSNTVSVTANATYYVKVSAGEATGLGSGKYALTLAFAGVALPSVTLPTTLTLNGLDPNGGGGEAIALESEKSGSGSGSYYRTLNWEDRVTNATAIANDGTHVVVYMSSGQDGSGFGIYAQLFKPDGSVKKAEWRVNATTLYDQVNPAVAMDPNGNFVIVWASLFQDGDGYAVVGQRFNNAGTAQGGEFIVNQTTSNDQTMANVAMNANGDFVVTWTDGDIYDSAVTGAIRARTYYANGTAKSGEIAVNSYTAGNQQQSTVGIDGSGNFVVVWQSEGQDGSGWGVYGRRFGPTGSALTTEFRVNQTTTYDQMKPTIAMASNGTFVVAWQSYSSLTGWDVYARRYTAAAVAAANEFRVNLIGISDQIHASVAIQPGGNFVVTWQGWDPFGYSGWDIYSRLFLYNGLPLSTDLRVNTTTSWDQTEPSVAVNSNGRTVYAWAGYGSDGANSILKQTYQAYTGSALSNLEAGKPHGFDPDGHCCCTTCTGAAAAQVRRGGYGTLPPRGESLSDLVGLLQKRTGNTRFDGDSREN